MIRPASSPAQPDPVSRRARTTIMAPAATMPITEGTRMTAGLVPTTIQPCSIR
jgi:hypothetical protein